MTGIMEAVGDRVGKAPENGERKKNSRKYSENEDSRMKGIKRIIYRGRGQLNQVTTLYPSKCIKQTPEYEKKMKRQGKPV